MGRAKRGDVVEPKQPQQLVLNIVAQSPRPAAAPRKAKAEKPAPKGFPRIPSSVADTARALTKRGKNKLSKDHTPAFVIAKPAPGVVPKDHSIAMDSQLVPINWAGGSIDNIAFNQGYTFLGYPYLSELAQVAEYRLISEVISTEATRKWIKIKSASDEDDKSDKIKALNKEFDRLDVRDAFRMVSLQDGFFGRSHLFVDTGGADDSAETRTPIGDGNNFSKVKFRRKKGFLRALKTVEPVWTYPMNYNSNDPLADDWYAPEVWYVMAKPVHKTRLLTFVSKPVPDLLKPAFSFGGLSLTQMAKPYVDNWLETRQSVNDIINAFSVMVLKTDLSTMMQDNGQQLYDRADVFNGLRDSRGLMMVDKNTEDFANVSAPLSSLDKLQAQAQEHMASVSRIPMVKLTGLSPSGLNASSDGEIRAFYDTIHAYQEQFFRPHLTAVFRLAQLSLWGEVDEDLTFDFEPLWELDEKAITEMQKMRAETHEKYVGMGAVDGENVRESLADDPNSPYSNIDPAEEPDIQVEPENMSESVGGENDTDTGGEKPPGEPAAPQTAPAAGSEKDEA